MVTFCKLQKGMTIGGHYEVLNFLGRGSMGAVYLAKDRNFEDYNRVVACKILPKELRQTPGREQYFKREFLAAQELVHQNICCTYEFGEDEDLETYYLIMEYVQGKTLRCLMNEKVYTLEEALPLIEQIATGLDFAHRKGILHLDMKPDNIVIADGDQAKIMDFGLARVINQSMTHISLMDVEGTPLYMSPEQINPKAARKRVDHAVDRWAVGVIVYEMLAGYPPFDGRMGITPLIYSIINAQPEPFDIEPDAWDVISRMLSKNSRDRYSSCTDFYNALYNPSISSTTYIPLGKTSRFEKTKRKGKNVLSSVLPLDSENSDTSPTETDLAIDPYAVSPGAATLRSSIISLGEGPEEIPVESSQIIKNEELADSEQTSEKDHRQVTQSRLSVMGRKTELPSFVWNEVKPMYPSVHDVYRAQKVHDFKFFSVNTNKYLVYRHLQTGDDFVLIPSGTFMMGSDKEGKENERPRHKVYLDPYLMAVKPLSQEIWKKITGDKPSFFSKPGNYPVEQISWEDLQGFCEKTGLKIPSEAQWEKACRAGTKTIFYWGDKVDDDYLWYGANSGHCTHPTGGKKPNQYGLYDMCGNVWEWCLDDFDKTAYRHHGRKNPVCQKSEKPTEKVRRGGSWLNRAEGCRCAIRQSDIPTSRARGLGARVSFLL